jgi:tagatose-1,6-bisphosphate aldolase
MQELIKKEETKTKQSSEANLAEFQALKSKTVTELATTRLVNLKFTFCQKQATQQAVSTCGCGFVLNLLEGDDTCIEVDVAREVPVDSAMKDGDRAHTIEPTDRILDYSIFDLKK